MLTEEDIKILQALSSRLLAKRREIEADVSGENGVNASLQKLVSMGCVEELEPMGEKCFVITKKGSDALRESRLSLNRLD